MIAAQQRTCMPSGDACIASSRGVPPFQAATAMDTVIQVLSDELNPTAASSCIASRDVRTICLKCLEKEPGHRYASNRSPRGRPAPIPDR